MPINTAVQPRLALHFDLVPRNSSLNADAAFLEACVAWLGLDSSQQLSWDTPSNHTLDGGRILIGLLPPAAAVQVARIEPYGMFVVLGLMATRTLGMFLAPFYAFGLAIVELVM